MRKQAASIAREEARAKLSPLDARFSVGLGASLVIWAFVAYLFGVGLGAVRERAHLNKLIEQKKE